MQEAKSKRGKVNPITLKGKTNYWLGCWSGSFDEGGGSVMRYFSIVYFSWLSHDFCRRREADDELYSNDRPINLCWIFNDLRTFREKYFGLLLLMQVTHSKARIEMSKMLEFIQDAFNELRKVGTWIYSIFSQRDEIFLQYWEM